MEPEIRRPWGKVGNQQGEASIFVNAAAFLFFMCFPRILPKKYILCTSHANRSLLVVFILLKSNNIPTYGFRRAPLPHQQQQFST